MVTGTIVDKGTFCETTLACEKQEDRSNIGIQEKIIDRCIYNSLPTAFYLGFILRD